jgi:hypothetical protein
VRNRTLRSVVPAEEVVMARWRARSSFLCSLLVLLASCAHAESGGFVMLAGRDTVAIERYTREATQLSGVTLFRPAGLRFEWVVTLGPDGGARRLTTAVHAATAAADAVPQQTGLFVWTADSVFADVHPGQGGRYATPRGSLPYLNPSMAMLEQIVRTARRTSPPRTAVPVFMTAGGRSLEVEVRTPRADTVTVVFAGLEFALVVDREGRIRSGRLPAQDVTFQRLDAVPDAWLGLARPDYSVPSGAPYTADEVHVPMHGRFALSGTLTRPKGKGPFPCVLLLTGSGPQDRDEAIPLVPGYRPFRQIADTLARRGIASLRLDDRGTGASQGAFSGSTSADFADDAEDALQWLTTAPGIDAKRLAVLGHSEGGLLAPMIVSRGVKVSALVLMAAPAWEGRRVIHEQNRYAAATQYKGAALDSVLRAADRSVASQGIADPWLGYFLGHDPLPIARQVRVPVLLLQGETDRQVTAGQVDELAAAIRAGGNPSVTVHRLPDTDHLFLPDPSGDPAGYMRLPSRLIPPSTLGILADWLATQLRVGR